MINKKKWFTIIEIIIATWILTISVFWVYKLISENNKMINNSNIYLNTSMMWPMVENCIKNLSPSIWSKIFFNLWDDYKNCNYSTVKTTNTIDNIDYILSAEWINKPIWTIWNINIYSDLTWNIESRFIQK